MAQINSEVRAIFINGGEKVPVVDGSFTWNRGGKSREAVLGSGGVLGQAETNMPGECSFDLAYITGMDPSDYDTITNAQIRVVFDFGAEWLLKRAFATEPSNGTAGTGVISLAFQGDPWLITKK